MELLEPDKAEALQMLALRLVKAPSKKTRAAAIVALEQRSATCLRSAPFLVRRLFLSL